MNERLEIKGDWYEEINLEEERRAACEQAMLETSPTTDDDVQAHFEDWSMRNQCNAPTLS